MKNPVRIAFVSFLVLVSLGSVATTAGAGEKEFKRTGIFNLTEEPKFKPTRVFLSANAGPYLKKIKWTGWGTNKAIGRGRFISDCSSCGKKENKAAKITLRKLKPCPAYKVMSYDFGKLKVFDRDRPNRVAPLPLGCP